MKIIISLSLIFILSLNIAFAGVNDILLAPTKHAYESICSDVPGRPTVASIGDMCQVVTKSEVCKEVPKEDLLKCDSLENQSQLSAWDFIKGCSKGAFNSATDILSFMWEVLKWAGEHLTSIDKWGETKDQVSEYMGMAKLYLHTEYQKAFAQSSPPAQDVQAIAKMGGAIGNMLMKTITDMVSKQYTELGCMNFEAKSKFMCKIVGDVFLPPAGMIALLKYGPKAVEKFPNLRKLFMHSALRNSSEAFLALAKKYPALNENLKGISKGIDKAMPFSNGLPMDVELGLMKKPEFSGAVKAAHKKLNDKKELQAYFEKLYMDTAERMAASGKPENLLLLEQGRINERDMLITLFQRAKESGDNKFTRISGKDPDHPKKAWERKNHLYYNKKDPSIDPSKLDGDVESFKAAVRNGPFIDEVFLEKGHGKYTHIIQRDIVREVVKKEMGGSPEKFWQFMGSDDGIKVWDKVFDANESSITFNRPEVVQGFLNDTYKLKLNEIVIKEYKNKPK